MALLLYLFLPFHSPVLIPSLDLYLGQSQFLGQFHPVRSREIFLTLKSFL